MKKLSILVLVVFALVVALAACAPQADPHEHAFSDEWCADANYHWHVDTCDSDAHEEDAIASKFEHRGYEEDGICDVCDYYKFYTLSVDAPQFVTIAGDLTGKGEDVTFTASVSDAYKLYAEGAEQVGEAVLEDGVLTYTFKFANLSSADEVVKITYEQVKYAIVVDEGVALFENLTSNFNNVDVEVEIPAAGNYVIFGDVDGITYNGEYGGLGHIEASEAGKVTVTLTFFNMSETAPDFEVAWTVVSLIDEIKLPAASGEGYELPTVGDVELTFTVPTAGMYYFSAEGFAFGEYMDEKCLIVTTEDNEVVTLNGAFVGDAEGVTAPFVWKLEAPTFTEMVLGENAYTAIGDGVYYPHVFTPSVSGTYEFVDPESYVYAYYWNTEYDVYSGIYDPKELEGGVPFYFFVKASYDVEEGQTVDTKLVITKRPNEVTLEDTEAEASADGVENFITHTDWNYDIGEYVITAPDGTLMSFDNGETWVSTYTAMIELDERCVFLVKNATESAVTLTVEMVKYELELNVGENTVTLAPGKSYLITDLNGIGNYAMTSLVWSDSNVVLMYNMMPYVSGEEFQWAPMYVIPVLVNNATEEITVTIKVVDPSASEAPGGEDGPATPDGTESNPYIFDGVSEILVSADYYNPIYVTVVGGTTAYLDFDGFFLLDYSPIGNSVSPSETTTYAVLANSRAGATGLITPNAVGGDTEDEEPATLTLSTGANTVSVVNGTSYQLLLNGVEYGSTVKLTWEGSAVYVLDANNMVLISGGEFVYFNVEFGLWNFVVAQSDATDLVITVEVVPAS